MDVVAAFVADAQAPVLVQPSDRAFHDPTLLAEAGAVRALRPGDLRLDAPPAQLAAPVARVVSAVAVQLARPTARTAAAAAQRRDRVDEREQLRDVVAVAAGE